MINSYKDYSYYLETDKIALGISKNRPDFFGDEIWKFQRVLRKLEYYKNCKSGYLSKIIYYKTLIKYFKLSLKIGVEIPPNVFGPGLSIAHKGTIVINTFAKIGANCRIHTCVNIGTAAGYESKAPIIGDNVYIAPGVKIFGEIIIANNIAIGANAVVNKSFTEPNINIAGIPAKKISDKGSAGLLDCATEIFAKKYSQVH